MNIETLIKAQYSGQLDASFQYTNIGVQTISILIGGIVLWRVSNMLHQRKLKQRAEKSPFKTRFSEHLKNR
jgi:hypothetical protein